jgi:hypothetical protein
LSIADQQWVQDAGLLRTATVRAERRVPSAISILAVTLLAVIYNAVLAAANARGVPVSYAAVAATEAAVLLAAAILLMRSGMTNDDVPVLAFGYFSLLVGVAVSLLNERIFLDGIRSVALICLFTMLGLRSDGRTVQRIFLLLTILVLCFLLLEIVATGTYVSIFEPAIYYEQTRGIEQFSLDDSGLFRNALGYEGRVQFSSLSDHRTSSIFIDQVSLANYTSVLGVYLLATWRSLGWRSRTLHVAAICLVLLTNSSRTGAALACIAVIGYFVYPLLPRYLIAAVAPIMVGFAAIVAYLSPYEKGDHLAGRLGFTIRSLGEMDLSALMGLRIDEGSRYFDSGYCWVIVTSTIFGLLALWAYVSFFPARRSVDERRAAWALAIYIFTNMLIGGTAIFSAKVAPPLWLLIGHLRRGSADEPPAREAARRSADVPEYARPLGTSC